MKKLSKVVMMVLLLGSVAQANIEKEAYECETINEATLCLSTDDKGAKQEVADVSMINAGDRVNADVEFAKTQGNKPVPVADLQAASQVQEKLHSIGLITNLSTLSKGSGQAPNVSAAGTK